MSVKVLQFHNKYFLQVQSLNFNGYAQMLNNQWQSADKHNSIPLF